MIRLHWVRHGENPANLSKEFSCRRVDYALTARGVLQAEQTAAYFHDRDMHTLFTSPLRRAIQTAEIIAAAVNLPISVVEEFRELNVGALEGEPVTPELWALHDSIIAGWFTGDPERSFPGGDNYHTLWNRIRAGLERVLEHSPGPNAVVVGHGAIFKITLREYCRELDLDTVLPSPSRNCSVSELLLERREGALAGDLVTWAATGHLSGPAVKDDPGKPGSFGLMLAAANRRAQGQAPAPAAEEFGA